MSSEEIRQSFLEFFKKKQHAVVFSSSLIPDDPSVLLTTAGMQQFKKYYTSELNALNDFGSQRTVSIQKCFRSSDIESVGDKTHMTFFEMLGNFSFGPVGVDELISKSVSGYFKRAALHWGFEFITQILGISTNRINVSVFKGDDEAPFDEKSYKIWHEEIGIPKEKIILGNREDNFWGPTGESGPCGPCSEIYVDNIEIWNIVFNEFFKEKDGNYRPLENPGVDTGMGLERLTAVISGVDNIFETDVFRPLIDKINELAPELNDRLVRILADHLRASIFLIANDIRPLNKEAGYILRRLLRRIMAYTVKYDIHADLFPSAVEIIKDKFAGIYPEVKETKIILGVLEDEKVKFQEAIGKGIKKIEQLKEITAKEAFLLYESFGLPFELIQELAPISAIKNLKKHDFDEEFKKHQQVSRAGQEKKFGGHGLSLDSKDVKVIRLHTATHLLHLALREVFGSEVKQMGSDINSDRLRFDFSFNRKLTPEEIKKMENLVNEKIKDNLPVYFKEMPKEEAEKIGALHFFKEKYPEIVRVYFIGGDPNDASGYISAEFCAGPHVEKTSEIGKFQIIKEESLGAGLRRIRGKI